MALSKRKSRTPQKPLTGVTLPKGRPSATPEPFSPPAPPPINSGETKPVIPPGKDVSGLGFSSLPPSSGGNYAVEDWLSWLYTFQGRDGYNFDTLLKSLGNNSTNPLISLLAAMLFRQGGDITESQASDWNKQLLDQIINYVNTLDTRNYNESMRDEQRLYDNPQNQLARLMGAGISRDAAIQLLGEQQAPIQSEPTEPASGLSPSESLANEVDARTKNINAAFQAVGVIASAVGGLGSFGLSAASLGTMLSATKASTANTLLNNEQLKKTLNGIDVASSVIGALSSYENSGKALPDFSSVQDMTKFIRDNVSGFEPFKALDESGALAKIPQDVYALTALNDGYMNWRKSKDFNIDRNHIVRMQGISELRGAIDIELVESEVAQNYTQIDSIINSMINDNIRTDVAYQVGIAQADLLEQQAEGQRLENVITRVDANFYGANADSINGMRVRQLMFEASCWEQFSNDPVRYKKAIQGWLDDVDNAATAAALESIYLTDELESQQNIHEPRAFLAQGIRNTALWFHNLTREALNERPATQHEQQSLGKFAKSAAMLYLTRKP